MNVYYLYDGVCAWSYGALPLIERLMRLHKEDKLTLTLINAGIFTDDGVITLDEQAVTLFSEMEQSVEALSGQTISEPYRRNVLVEDEVIDSWYPLLGSVISKTKGLEAEFQYMNDLLKMRYQEGIQTCDWAAVANVLEARFGLSFRNGMDMETKKYLKRANNLREAADQWLGTVNANGVPAIIVEKSSGAVNLLPHAEVYGDPDGFERRFFG